MMFVLAAMMLLLSLCTSLLVAAGANVGAGVNTQNVTQMKLYADSLNRTVLASLRAADDIGALIGSSPATLGGLVLQSLSYPDGEYFSTQTRSIDLSPSFEEMTGLDAVFSNINLTIDAQLITEDKIVKRDEWGHWELDAEGNETTNWVVDVEAVPWSPKKVSVSAEATLTFTTAVGGKSVVSVTAFELKNAYLEEPSGHEYSSDAWLEIIDAGTWTVVSHE